jgi:hypothetical protein
MLGSRRTREYFTRLVNADLAHMDSNFRVRDLPGPSSEIVL